MAHDIITNIINRIRGFKMDIGIDKLNFFTSDMYVDMGELAETRKEDPNKYLIGIGQKKQAVIPNSQDSVTLAANAAGKIVDDFERKNIDLILFGTESGVDSSKSAAVYLQGLLKINPQASGVELKQACFGLTAGIQLAMGHIMMNPNSRVLLVGSDIARYGINTPGEPTQGGGAVAMIMSAKPSILKINPGNAHLTKDIMDFWRPLYRKEALVDGKYSSREFIDFFDQTFNEYKERENLSTSDFDALIFHLPYTKMGLKALRIGLQGESKEVQQRLFDQFDASKQLNAEVGNLYTGSLYLSLISLLKKGKLKDNDLIGLFSYGSGAEGEFFTANTVPGFKSVLENLDISWLDNRRQVTVSEYEDIYKASLEFTDRNFLTGFKQDKSEFKFMGQTNQQRMYK